MATAVSQKDRKKTKVWRSFFEMLRKVKVPWGWLLLAILITLGYSTIMMLFPDYTQQVINGDVSSKTLVTLVSVILGSLLLNSASTAIKGITDAKVGFAMEQAAWKSISGLTLSDIEKENTKELISRVTTDTRSISQMLSMRIPYLLQYVYTIVASVMMANSYDGSLLITLVLLLVAQVILASIVGRVSFNLQNKAQKKLAEMTKIIAEIIANISVVKIFSSERKETERGDKAIKSYYRASLIAESVSNGLFRCSYLVNVLGMLIVIIQGGHLVTQGRIDIGQWIAYFMYYQMMTDSIKMFFFNWKEVYSCQGKLHRLAEIITTPEEDIESGEHLTPCKGDFTFDNVSFSYGSERKILNNVSFRIPAGKFVAIAGMNGAGKTTILSLLERFYCPDEGKITYAGKDVSTLNLADWRALFSYVPQDVRLMSGTIRENILYGVDRAVSEDELRAACKKARADRFIDKLPDGLETRVDEFGDNFSGGQRQQIAIARAILRDRECLLLDEFTSNLDPEAEAHVLDAIREISDDKTVIVVAHKISTIEKADSIILLDQGEVEAAGDNDRLIRESKVYRTMAATRFATV